MDANKTRRVGGRKRRQSLMVGLATAVTAATLAPGAQALTTSASATGEVQRWASPKEFAEPYALVEVLHEGRALDRTPITRCKGQYADEDLTVRISTCGDRWRVRAAYVSMSGKREHFTIKYAPRSKI